MGAKKRATQKCNVKLHFLNMYPPFSEKMQQEHGKNTQKHFKKCWKAEKINNFIKVYLLVLVHLKMFIRENDFLLRSPESDDGTVYWKENRLIEKWICVWTCSFFFTVYYFVRFKTTFYITSSYECVKLPQMCCLVQVFFPDCREQCLSHTHELFKRWFLLWLLQYLVWGAAALTWWDEECLALLQGAFVAFVHLIGEEHLAVTGRGPPTLKQRQVGWGGLDEEEDLFSLQPQIKQGSAEA